MSVEQQLDKIAQLIGQGHPDLAAQQAQQLRAQFPEASEPARLHGVALLSMNHVDEAVTALEAAQRLDPRSVEAICNLSSALMARNDARAALIVIESAMLIAPKHPAVLNGLGNARRAVGDAIGSRDAYFEATRAAPAYLGAWLNLAAAELAIGNASASETILRMILKQTAHPQALLLLGQSLVAQHRLDEAASVCREGERLAPADANFPYQLGQIADEQKLAEDAAQAHARAFGLDPALTGALAQLVFIKRQLCDDQGLDALSSQLRAAVAQGASDITPFGFLAEPATAEEQLHCARQFAEALAVRVDPLKGRSHFPYRRPQPGEPLRIGFASNGFGNHPTGLLTVAFFEALQQQNVETHLFATAPADGSPIQHRLQTAASHWHEIGGSTSRAMAEAIAATGVEILMDLRVWGGGNISDALALRPAPIQVNWLAYPGTSGAHWIDYLIADRQVVPDGLRTQFSEQVAWLSRCFQPSDPGRVVAEPPSRQQCGLPESGTVYVCFNNSYKLDQRSRQRMFSILRAVPDSVLWLLSGPGRSNERFGDLARAAGIDPQRLIFMDKLPHAEYLTRYRHADLFLDTCTYNAHTTASDALWSGCPVLTTAGDTFAARVAASLNHHLGMEELSVGDDDAFIEMAIRIGQDRATRDRLHERLAERRHESGLFDMHAFAGDFVQLLEKMADRHRKGLAPAPID
ncbi:hypothetical protein, partial [Dokdonella sp.]|uniref:O-linked N-acetylglucosamine transferase, SPINDLY family protein n=1 Tax=Dokdonella sp. TaxID=2291710 RepID=UPI003C5BBADF